VLYHELSHTDESAVRADNWFGYAEPGVEVEIDHWQGLFENVPYALLGVEEI
jgi:hypothetical protein